jgi:ubiquinone/menaquinone biosynthesis C-methylase UbiE
VIAVTDTYDAAVTRAESPTRTQSVLRAYSDAVNDALVHRWLPVPCRRLLKTDLFDEAVGVGLFPQLEHAAGSVVAVDASDRVLEAARRRYPELVGHVADVRELPFPDASFDVVVSNSTLDHFESLVEVEVALAELVRVLEPQGTLIVTIDNLRHPLVALRNALPFPLLAKLGLVPYFVGATCGPKRLRRLLEAAGAEVVEETAIMHVPRLAVVAAVHVATRGSGSILRAVSACERAEALPTRTLTGQFIAARAVKR